MTSQAMRERFIHFFTQHGHTHLPSSPVIPKQDPTLLFVNAGMNQFKDIFLGKQPATWPAVTTCQKCIRVGGKHNDLENVGHTSRHLTFFEMVGNFSFGDYFKEKAIFLAFTLVTEVLQLDLSRIWATVLHNDEESFLLWQKYLPKERICRMSEKDNFWAMGDTGPCGPCSELLYDRGPSFGTARSPAEDVTGERFFEFWNLVFMESNRDHSGKMTPLPKQCVDTGAGLERLVLLTQGVNSLFETDILRSIIGQVERLSGKSYQPKNQEEAPAFHVIADHLRSLVFAISDGVEPSNLDRGYVLRKILRRACRYGRILGLEKPFLGELAPFLITQMKESYPELVTAQSRVQEILLREEESFLRTLKRGGALLQEVVVRARASGGQIKGEDAFTLKDTYGLPLEEILLFAKDGALTVDVGRFEELEHEAKLRSKAAHKKESQMATSSYLASFVENKGSSTFTGYSQLTDESTIIGILKKGEEASALYEGEEGEILLDHTPFYAEMGGQVGDQGSLTTEKAEALVIDCKSPYPDAILHTVVVKKGTLHMGDPIVATVDQKRRIKIQNNHTATHLLHWALKTVLGAHVQQAGSVVEPTRLRFDFRHHKPLTPEELTQIEDLVNQRILQNKEVSSYERSYDEVKGRADIQQMFGEKYGKTVRIIDIDFSKELCGGTHTWATGTIGQLRILKEASIATGIRRIEAVTGEEALALGRDSEQLVKEIALLIKAQPTKVKEKIEQLLEEQKQKEQELKKLKQHALKQEVEALSQKIEIVGSFRFLGASISYDAKELADLIFQKEEPLVLLLLEQKSEGLCSLFVRVSKPYAKQGVSAAALLQNIGKIMPLRGGGKEELAQGSSSEIGQMANIVNHSKQWLSEIGVKHS